MSLLPEDMYVGEVHGSWSPLDQGDVLANLFPGDRLWPAQSFYNRLATRSGATVLPVGGVPDSQLERWLAFLGNQGVTAIAAPPDTLQRLLVLCESGLGPRWLRKLLIGGPFHDPTPERLISQRLPGVQVWQLYGSAEAWMVGHRGPGCAEDVFHLLPHQHAEIDGDRILVTTTGVHRAPPLIRYVIGDRGVLAPCACGRPGRTIRVLGRLESSVTVQGRPIRPDELVGLAIQIGEVAAAQVAVSRTDAGAEQLQLRVRLAEGVPDDDYTRDWIRHQVLSGHLALEGVAEEESDAFEVVAVDQLPGLEALPGLR
ncbi:hypothetical protein RM780_06915 [Streptomyces sp. DSM 44917]|uniref:AMP-dependent synthetase/ligase domain-containing protein n=1 Tax=Streptomyces boetiae TaxID=3075541 RepID=A0ABU2L555_9ACTN|nr:hypothetical protein [Streptomyces sp. DSM 44917]MDT0306691.1 hypothetical protein [Streptomyces sp. DSM 44917]